MMRSITILAIAGLLTASLVQQAQAETPVDTAAQPASETQTVKSTDGSFEGEIVGTIAPDSRFAKLKIGMTMAEVNKLIKAPDDLQRHETGKRWIPFYFGDDAQRMQATYTGEGCLTYTGGNVFGGGGNQLIRITADPQGCAAD
ncbi:MAG: hypothetical protein B7Z03_03650 [Hydrogenophilales bacterium 32-62-9]|nr:MAG: hypothetical protein B7Z03_03650 [Hydrogenophilales bacterium 32-62-9]